jgi:hypothetical protein
MVKKNVLLVDYIDEDWCEYDNRCKSCSSRFKTNSESICCPTCGVKFDNVYYRTYDNEKVFSKNSCETEVEFKYKVTLDGEEERRGLTISREEVRGYMNRRDGLEECGIEVKIKCIGVRK